MPHCRDFLPILENHLAGDSSRRTHDAAAWMSGGAAHIKVVDRRAVIGPTGYGAQEEKLLERKLALKNITLGQAEFPLEVEWRQHLPCHDNLFDVGRMFRDRIDDGVAKGVALIVPRAFRKLVRRILHEARWSIVATR